MLFPASNVNTIATRVGKEKQFLYKKIILNF